jgi:hypothetical protein
MTTSITLRLDDAVIRKAKKTAGTKGISLVAHGRGIPQVHWGAGAARGEGITGPVRGIGRALGHA